MGRIESKSNDLDKLKLRGIVGNLSAYQISIKKAAEMTLAIAKKQEQRKLEDGWRWVEYVNEVGNVKRLVED